jgi:hypothetical protein
MPRKTAIGKVFSLVCLLAFTALLTATGCGGPDYKARGTVKGKVTTGKKSLTTGSVMFHNANGITASASIDPDGNYVMNDAPIGDCTVTVTVNALPMDASVRARLKGGGPKIPEMKNPDAPSPDLPSGPAVPKEIVPIDPKYSKPETSGLKIKVEKGEQTFDIEL